MILQQIHIQNFRNLSQVKIAPISGLNIVYGPNGSGKSSLLEALHYFGFGRSFRTSKHHHVISHGLSDFTLFSQSIDSNETDVKLGIQRSRNGDMLVKLNGEKQSRVSDLVKLFPVQIFTPQSSDVLTGSPKLRRRYLDWGLFHVEQSFLELSSQYSQCVKQRNSILRSLDHRNQIDKQEAFWLDKIAGIGDSLNNLRLSYIEALKPYIQANLMQFLPEFCLEISYYRGWEKGYSLSESLERNRQKDLKIRYTTVGPHKADFKFRINGINANECLSRGQLRMLMAALQLAQTQHYSETKNSNCIFLLDDIGAELDKDKRHSFVSSLLETDAQLFVTAIDQQQFDYSDNDKMKKVFHVEHGHVKEE